MCKFFSNIYSFFKILLIFLIIICLLLSFQLFLFSLIYYASHSCHCVEELFRPGNAEEKYLRTNSRNMNRVRHYLKLILIPECTDTNRLHSPEHRTRMLQSPAIRRNAKMRALRPVKWCLTDGSEWNENNIWCGWEKLKSQGKKLWMYDVYQIYREKSP